MIKGLLFDLNGTLIDIMTNEYDDNVYRTTANFLSYYNVVISPEILKEKFFNLNRKQRNSSCEEFPEFDSAKIFSDIITEFSQENIDNIELLSAAASRVFRASSRFKLELYPGVTSTLYALQDKYKMAAVTDGQTLWAVPELQACKIDKFFSFIIVSGDYGFRKPDCRLFDIASEKFALPKDEIIFIGNDMYRDVYGAKRAGMKSIFFKSNQGSQSFYGEEPDYIIYNIPQLLDAVCFLENHSLDRMR